MTRRCHATQPVGTASDPCAFIPTVSASTPVPSLVVTTTTPHNQHIYPHHIGQRPSLPLVCPRLHPRCDKTTHHPAPSTVPYAATRHPDSVLSSPPPHHPAPPSFTLVVTTTTTPHHPVPSLFPLRCDDDDATSPSAQAAPPSSPLTTTPWPTAGEDSCCQRASRLHDVTQRPISQRPRLHLCVVMTTTPWHPAGEDTVLRLISPSSSPLHLDDDDSCQLVVPPSSLCVTARRRHAAQPVGAPSSPHASHLTERLLPSASLHLPSASRQRPLPPFLIVTTLPTAPVLPSVS
ncbi:hypothetical protein BDQ17DRAFT_1437727 [Cyathus striatus]|nr:hypothetical protein BDQ17DRAFT_1437727 [Cyathus striatus]